MAENQEQERTEAATPRRRQEAREQGQVALSHELTGAIVLLGVALAISVGGGSLVEHLGSLIVGTIEHLREFGTRDLTSEEAAGVIAGILWKGFQLIALAIVPLFVLVLALSYGQIGFAITPNGITFDPARLDPMKGFDRVLGLRGGARTLFALAKIVLITTAMVATAYGQMGHVSNLGSSELGPALAGLGYVTVRCVGAALVAVASLALLDFGYQRWQHERDLRMTKQEVRQEIKQSEGDPHVKSRIRRLQRELASRRMMQDVPKATVVVTNPTHFAVALRYEREDDARRGRAPKVVAKGADLVAQRIKELAREAGVIVYEDAPLARALHARCEIGDEIPVELYQAVAGVLAYVFKLQGKREFAGAR